VQCSGVLKYEDLINRLLLYSFSPTPTTVSIHPSVNNTVDVSFVFFMVSKMLFTHQNCIVVVVVVVVVPRCCPAIKIQPDCCLTEKNIM
jgi:hypothetical protein